MTMEGYIGDAAMTFPVGEISEVAERLLRVTEESLMARYRSMQGG